MTVVLDTLEQLAALAETMLGAAGLGEWEKLASLEARRQSLANSLPASLANDLSGATSTRAQALIERYLRHHHDLLPLVHARLDELRVVLRAAPPPSDIS